MAIQVGTVIIEGTECPIIKGIDGRLWAGDSVTLEQPRGHEGRAWNAMTMEMLHERIQRTFR